jgi:lipoprotein-anchoring transpeptidase ErfK/SrfK
LRTFFCRPLAGFCIAATGALLITAAQAQPLNFAPAPAWFNPFAIHQTPVTAMHGNMQASAPANAQERIEEDAAPTSQHEADPARNRLARQVVAYATGEAPGTIVIDTGNTYLYLVLGNGKALRYGIGVGRKGFTWSGIKSVTRKAKWPDWTPPPEMLKRQPYLPRFMAGGPQNPLGARAMYLSGSVYRIHGTNAPSSIGKRMSSGCFRMLNADVIDLYERVKLGAKVVVLPHSRSNTRLASR